MTENDDEKRIKYSVMAKKGVWMRQTETLTVPYPQCRRWQCQAWWKEWKIESERERECDRVWGWATGVWLRKEDLIHRLARAESWKDCTFPDSLTPQEEMLLLLLLSLLLLLQPPRPLIPARRSLAKSFLWTANLSEELHHTCTGCTVNAQTHT